MENCLFCRVIEHKAAAKIVHEDDRAVVIQDIHPQAPVHLLVIPRQHFSSLHDLEEQDEALLGHLFLLAAKMARGQGLQSRGYRTVVNTGPGAGQSIFHLHVHLLGGRPFHWPPG